MYDSRERGRKTSGARRSVARERRYGRPSRDSEPRSVEHMRRLSHPWRRLGRRAAEGGRRGSPGNDCTIGLAGATRACSSRALAAHFAGVAAPAVYA
jgi:hypothetical protein